ncbi:DUF3108 domain-containing protein [Litorivicinus sp.]|jgi:hypothetical protein|nr:DUF3108 domain-containing protein [Litorivicinus sp.]
MLRIGQFLILLLSFEAPAFDGKILHYEIDWGPVILADLEMELLAEDPIRSVKVNIASRGVTTWISEFQSKLEIVMLKGGARILDGTGKWGDSLSNITVSWLPDQSEPLVDLYRSKPRKYALTPLPPGSTGGTVDPFTPLFEISAKLAQGGACKGDYRVFDGVRRYDLVITNGGQISLPDGTPSVVGEIGFVCDVELTKIGGFSARRGLFSSSEAEITRTVWFGNLRNHWIPVRVEVNSPFGAIVARFIEP